MRKQEAMKSQGRTCVLRVDNIHCDGCKGKIRKLLKKIDGVYATSIDMEQGKVTVTGNVDPAMLIRKLEKSGKHAEIWRNSHNSNNNIQFDVLNNQFKSLQMGNVKGGGGGDKKHYNNHQIKYQPSVQETKGFKAPINMKDQRTVKFDLHKKGQGFDEFSEDDEFDEDEDFGDEDEDFDDEEFGYGGRQHSQKPVNGDRTKNGKLKVAGKEKKKGVKKGKKVGGGGGGFMSMILGKAIGRKGKDGKTGKKCGSNGGGIQKHGGGEGKIGKKDGRGKNGKFSDIEVTNHHNKGGGRHGGGGGGGMGQYRAPGIQGPPPSQNRQMMMNMAGGGGGMGQYRGPRVQVPPPPPPQGLQMMTGVGGGNGYYPGPQMNTYQQQQHMAMMMNPYQQQQQQQQQQQMAMLMNQQRMMDVGGGGDMMYHPAAYGRPQPGYSYGPAMMVPPSPARISVQEPYTHMFSDENTGSCSIM